MKQVKVVLGDRYIKLLDDIKAESKGRYSYSATIERALELLFIFLSEENKTNDMKGE